VTAIDPEYFKIILTAGDDYEILFTASPKSATALGDLARSFGVPITVIGHMTKRLLPDQSPVAVVDAEERPLAFTSEGWTHFGG
jgi:thiamine-monophosphate kinase